MKATLEKPRTKSGSMKQDAFDEKLWKERFPSEPYTVDSDDFDDYAPAYRLGTKLRSEFDDFDLHEGEIRKRWETMKDNWGLSGATAAEAAQWAVHALIKEARREPR